MFNNIHLAVLVTLIDAFLKHNVKDQKNLNKNSHLRSSHPHKKVKVTRKDSSPQYCNALTDKKAPNFCFSCPEQ